MTACPRDTPINGPATRLPGEGGLLWLSQLLLVGSQRGNRAYTPLAAQQTFDRLPVSSSGGGVHHPGHQGGQLPVPADRHFMTLRNGNDTPQL